MSNWVEVADAADFNSTDRKAVKMNGDREIALFRVGDEYFAVDEPCSHEKASLLLGEVSDHEVMCALHGARFDLRTGRNLGLPAVRPVGSYRVKVESGKIYVGA